VSIVVLKNSSRRGRANLIAIFPLRGWIYHRATWSRSDFYVAGWWTL